MTSRLRTILVFAGLALALPTSRAADDDPKAALQGIWVAQTIEEEGKSAPARGFSHLQFTFKKDKLFTRGFNCEEKPVLAIYEVKGDELKVWLRNQPSNDGRPSEFARKPATRLVLIVFKKQP